MSQAKRSRAAARWRKLDAVVQEVLDHAPEDRDRLLDELCDGDPELLEEVACLVEADRLAGDFLSEPCGLLQTPRVPHGAPLASPSRGIGPGSRLGAYELTRRIGYGGMGEVYHARRVDSSYHQDVAVKLLREDLDSGVIESRFRAERQILASLVHPSIARLLDGGASQEGLPYLVMEYVDGVPIDRHCDRRRLDVRARLELFLPVCSAVEFAHRNLVVHRDLKPTNILVADDGTPKLLDFGVAKILQGSHLPFRTETTLTGQHPMTLSYASPEQLSGGPVTTASDVYSLGVVLYLLLTGELPRRFSGRLPADVAELAREPVRPSVCVDRSGAEAAERRGVGPGQLKSQLRGDLDNVVLKALESDPARRYPSVAELEEDLRRHITGRPVLARQASWLYVSGKFVRRNRFATLAAAAFLALLVAFVAAMAVQSARLTRERDRAEQARAEAMLEKEKAEEVADLMVGLFDGVRPDRALGRELTVREVLDGRADGLDDEFEGQPELLATLKAKMGDVYRRIGAYEEARALLADALRIRQAKLPPDDPRIAETLSDLATVHGLRGDVPKAAELLERALPILRSRPEEEPALVPTLGRLAIARSILGEPEASEALSREVLEIQQRRFGPASAQVAHALHNLAIHKARHGEFSSARDLFERTLEIQESVLPAEDPNRVRTHHNLGALYGELGLYGDARAHLERALEGQERVFGPDHPEVAETLLSLGDVHRRSGDLDGAGALYERAHDIFDRGLDGRHPLMPDLQSSRGRLAAARGRFEEAERLYREALVLRRRAATRPGAELVDDLAALAGECLRSDDLAEARDLLEEARATAAGLRPDPHVSSALARALLHRGRLHRIEGETESAVAAWRRAIALVESSPVERDRRTRTEAERSLAEVREASRSSRG